MIEKKTLWAVHSDLEVSEMTALVEDGQVLAAKTAEDERYDGTLWRIRKFSDTEEIARKYVEDEEQHIREMVPAVMKFIDRMDSRYELLERLGIKKKDYLGHYADRGSSYHKEYNDEQEYTHKLEAFIRSHMLNIGGCMLPVADVKQVQWYFSEERGDEYEDSDWLAELTMADGTTCKTGSETEVRLVKTVFGENSGIYFVDNDFDYDKDEDEDEED